MRCGTWHFHEGTSGQDRGVIEDDLVTGTSWKPILSNSGAMVHHRSKQNGAIMGLGSPTVQHNKQQCCHWHPTQICLWLSMHVQQLFNLIPRILISKIPLGSTLRIWKSLGSPSPTGNERQTENIVFHRCFPFPAHENSSKFHGRWKHIKTYKNSDSWVWIVRIPGFQPNTRRQVSHRILPLDWWRSSRDVRLPTSWGENIPLPIQNGGTTKSSKFPWIDHRCFNGAIFISIYISRSVKKRPRTYCGYLYHGISHFQSHAHENHEI